jgi:hypothetical protein
MQHIYAMSNKSHTLPNDIARCNGISYNEDDGPALARRLRDLHETHGATTRPRFIH